MRYDTLPIFQDCPKMLGKNQFVRRRWLIQVKIFKPLTVAGFSDSFML